MKDTRRSMAVHNDELLYDLLPQPYRFINKILVKTIEEAIDLAEGGGSAETQNSFVLHNLRLTKVGKIPISKMNDFFLSTDITQQEITVYQFFANTSHLLVGTNQGTILIFDINLKQILLNLPISTLSKFAQLTPIIRLISFPTDHENYVIVYYTEESSHILFLNSTFLLRSPIELDLTTFSPDSILFEKCSQPYLIITDGNGHVGIWDCHTPSELIINENSNLKNNQPKTITLEPIIELEKCPISTGPVTLESNISIKVDDSTARKKQNKKKAPPPPKSRPRPKSPGSAPQDAPPIEITNYHAKVYILDNFALMRFGSFQILLLYSLQPNPTFLCDFSLPSPISCTVELINTNLIAIGFENGSFCFLNIKRKTISGHVFQRKGKIIGFQFNENILLTFTSNNNITAYGFDGNKTTHEIFTCSDEDIIQSFLINNTLFTQNKTTSDIGITQALSNIINWNERNLNLFPNISFLNSLTGKYIGTLSTPSNLENKFFLMSDKIILLIYNDPIENLVSTQNRNLLSPHGKRGSSPKGSKPNPNIKKNIKPNKNNKKVEENKEPEQDPLIPIKREIIGFVSINDIIKYFHQSISNNEKLALERREFLRSMVSLSKFNVQIDNSK